MRVIANAARLVSRPEMASCYASWVMSRTFRGRPPIISPHDRLSVGHWASFSELWLRREGVPEEERQLLRECRSVSPTPAIALDVGGNMGIFSLTLAAAGFDLVHTFEPIPTSFDRLSRNLKLNPAYSSRIQPHACGVSNAPGSLDFHIDPTSPGTCKIASATDIAPDAERINVPVVSLDAFCREQAIDRVDFLKIDVEGFEKFVVEGASEMLGRHAVRFVYLEVIPEAFATAGYSAADLYDVLEKHGYRPHLTVSSGPPPLSRSEFADRPPEGTRNVLFRV